VPWWPRTPSLRRDLALPLVLLAVQLTAAATIEGAWHLFSPPRSLGPVDWVLLVVGPVALVARRRHPVPVLWVCFAATLAPSGTGLTHVSFLVAFFVAATAGKRYPAWLALALTFVWTIWLAPLIYGYAVPANDALALAGWLLAVAIAAEATRYHAERAAATRASRQLDQRRQQSEERLRIARDLHDVIGHNISLINVQASMGLDLIDSQPEQARAALSAIKSASKEALAELRTMLTPLRGDDAAPRSPAPGLDRLPELIELTRAAGLAVEVEITGKAPPLPAAVQLAAYRIIQESLTNVARHAGQVRVTVRVTCDDANVHVQIDDEGKARSAIGAGSAIGTGSGITGMRERATALGGNLSAGFRHGGGFRVSARLPVRPAP
jgi:signal transduction histidine kinase